MVLNELGSKINDVLASLSKAPVIDQKVLDSLLKDICAALLNSDVNIKLVYNLKENVKKTVDLDKLAAGANKKKIIQNAVFDELCNLVDPGKQAWQPKKKAFNVIMTVGLQGSGKTTSCTKLANYYHRRGWKTALVCADTFRAADPAQIAAEGVAKFKEKKFELVIVDTSGRHKQESALFDEMKQIHKEINPDNVIFVMDGTIGQAAEAQATAFKESVDVGSIILTKMDGHAKGGGAVSAIAATKSPIIFIGTGEHIHDIEKFSARSFVSKMLGMGDISGLVETVQSLKLDDNQDLMKNISQGIFTLKDMRDQFDMIMKMGPLNKIAGMIPGIPPEILSGLGEDDGTKQMKQFMCIFDSMTEKELYSDGKIFESEPSRIERVAIGSGTSRALLMAMLDRHKMFGGFVKKMGANKGLLKNMAPGAAGMDPSSMSPSQMSRMQQQMSKMMNPQMMQAMNSGGGIQDMMKQMMGGGMGGMQDMINQMMGGGRR
ncbi:Signal recognition particle 54 kDa protein [Smittium culicis]|uniref:signal-recognition-particle GTPase n=1 Tax=Smittium culicis TaxID=133412 RepID=A0A1R1XHP5_9FUNG|nr:Signal recognition particle 54 kDa protein [Smittium culicis]OMJ16153.1 Signal recognition particle 54 kDa protein [Smittium culicis]